MNPYETLASYDRNAVLGELTQKNASELDRFFREAHRQAQAVLQEARTRAREQKREIEINCSRLSGVNGGDCWVVGTDARARRLLERFPAVEQQLLDGSGPEEDLKPCTSLAKARPLLARCAYNGLWSPSGTNWQPIRTIELLPQEVSVLAPRPGDALDPNGPCGLMVLARRRYDSILGDIARLCGTEPNCHAEDIDLGIWLLVAEQTARGHGWKLQRRLVGPDGDLERRATCTKQVKKMLRDRISRLQHGGAQGQRERETARRAAEELLCSLQADEHYPYCVLVPWEGRALATDEGVVGGIRPSAFDLLIEARCTQRVASPVGVLERQVLVELFELARSFVRRDMRLSGGPDVGDRHVDALTFPVFTWHDAFPEHVGRAMHQAVEGPGGFVQRVNFENLKRLFGRCHRVPEDIAQWVASSGEQLETRAEQIALPADAAPPHVLAKLLEGNLFHRHEGRVLDRRQRPLSLSLFLKLVRMMLGSFVRFSLGFHNTHPLLGVLLAPTAPVKAVDGESVYQAMGRVVAHMTLLSRARGYVSIIKSGPSEIAGDAIRELLSTHAVEGRMRQVTGSRQAEPVLTFQVGLPLGPDETVCAGQPDEHDGLKERLLDKRATRAPLARHYVPAPDVQPAA